MKRIEANARACDSGRARLRAAASSAPAEQMHGVCDRRAPKACIGAPCAGNAYGANGRGANGCGANGRIRTRCRALARAGRASARATTTTTQARTTAHRTQSTARLSRATTRSSSRTGRLSSGRRNARALESGGACVASACIPSAIRCSSSHAGAPARAAAARTPLAGSPPGIALHCNARRQTSDARAFTSARARARTRAPNTATAARSRRATFERTRGRPGASGRPCARIGRLIDRRTACPPSPTNRAAPR
ncbi:Uncharacterised protein [Burkholderia pseudomallei]|nr:hypothetical protein AQ15_5257 [Burkholderia pseudomallei K96243]AJX40158.1 hypothetical protein DP45_04502 [Burkholderia pseudomallei]CAJ2993765.1 Uncharacterised protein [Burkholderia pseudomallei]CAJ3801643.1 Uncharacterised protein [Burkholderia pseudomallei]CAJ3920168.1 Uncharacterised protein [Burkholderia pseudomallei]